MSSRCFLPGNILLAGLAFLLAACSSFDPVRGLAGSYRNYTEIKGSIKLGRYTSPDHNFSCAVPELVDPGAVVKDSSGGTGDGRWGTAGFQDDLGKLLRVDWLAYPENARANPPDPLFDRIVQESFCQQMFALYQKVSPTATQVAHEYLADPDGEHLFAIFFLPGGSTITDNSTGKRLDAYRATLFFRHGDWVYCVTAQFTALPTRAAPTFDKIAAQLKQTLQVFRGSFEFP